MAGYYTYAGNFGLGRLRAGLAINASGVIRISLKNEHGSLKSDQNFLWAAFNGEHEKVVLVFSL
jgi:hypothetical protein